MTVTHLLKKLRAFYVSQRFIIASVKASHLDPILNQSKPVNVPKLYFSITKGKVTAVLN